MNNFEAAKRFVLQNWFYITIIILISSLTFASSLKIRGEPIVSDAKYTALVGYNLWHRGVYSENGIDPSNFREPLPVIVAAAHIGLFTTLPDGLSDKEILESPAYTRQIGRVNLLYVAVGLLASSLLALLTTNSRLVAIISVIGSWVFLYLESIYLNLPTSEFAAAAILTLSCASAVMFVRMRSILAAVALGVSVGCLILTKAPVLYVAMVAIPLLAGALVGSRVPYRRVMILSFAVALSMGAVITPWMVRNYVVLDRFEVAQRGGDVLMVRAMKNRMTNSEYLAAYYAYSPHWLRVNVFQRLGGYDPEDLRLGGKYQALTRHKEHDRNSINRGDVENTISYYGRAWAMKVVLAKELEARRSRRNPGDLEALQVRTAMKMIKADLPKHIQMTPLFAWRGIWSFGGLTRFPVVVVNFFAFAALVLLPLICIMRRDATLFAASIIPAGLFCFYAVLTHFNPRYSAQLVPAAVVLSIALLCSFAARTGVGKRLSAWVRSLSESAFRL